MYRDFVVGRNPFFLNFDFHSNSGFIRDREVSFTLAKCPELNIIDDLLWEETQDIKVSMVLSNSEDLKSE